MALPGNDASTFPVVSRFLYPDNLVTNALEDFEDGGVAIQDSTQGLQGHRWRCWLDGINIVAQRDGTSSVTLFSASNVKALSFAFDQAMRPHVTYLLNDGLIYLRWYDSTVPGYITSTFGAGRTPRLCLDDKRSAQINSSDVILAYLRDDALCYRQQRDRFGVERVIRTGIAPSTVLKNIGMGDNLRLHFELV